MTTAATPPAWATGAVLQVATNGTDAGNNNCLTAPCATISHAVSEAASGDTIRVDLGTYTENVTVPGTLTNLTIVGESATSPPVIGTPAASVFTISLGASVTLTDLAIQGGSAADGGGVNNAGTATLDNDTISGNTVSIVDGGGFYNTGTATLTDDTISGNTASGDGGGFYNAGTATLSNDTISGNTASTDGGGFYNDTGTVTLIEDTIATNADSGFAGGFDNAASADVAGTIIAGNTAPNCSVSGTTVDQGYNLGNTDGAGCGFIVPSDVFTTNALLGPLQYNGGPTKTQLPSSAPPSPAVSQIPRGTVDDAISLCPGTDQRGVARPQGTECTIGAVEVSKLSQPMSPPPITGPGPGGPRKSHPIHGNLPRPTDPVHGARPKPHLVTPPAHGTVKIHSNFTFNYRANRGYAGPDSFSFVVCDQFGNCTAPIVIFIFLTGLNCTTGAWPAVLDGYPMVVKGATTTLYIGVVGNRWHVRVTNDDAVNPDPAHSDFAGTVTIGPVLPNVFMTHSRGLSLNPPPCQPYGPPDGAAVNPLPCPGGFGPPRGLIDSWTNASPWQVNYSFHVYDGSDGGAFTPTCADTVTISVMVKTPAANPMNPALFDVRLGTGEADAVLGGFEAVVGNTGSFTFSRG